MSIFQLQYFIKGYTGIPKLADQGFQIMSGMQSPFTGKAMA
jgi:hypothetical protein